MNINQRQAYILSAIIDEYVRTAQPVASKTICEKLDLDVSPATVRNDMVQLETVGYLRQPHTSAGRVPTEEGYRFYLTIMNLPKRALRVSAPLKQIEVQDSLEIFAKKVAGELVSMSGEAAFVSVRMSDTNKKIHYTGLNNLFEKPDFDDLQKLRRLSTILDSLVNTIDNIGDIGEADKVWIGSENPFGDQVSTMVVKYNMPSGLDGIIGLIGPIRMDYQKNMKLLCEARKVMEESYEK